MPGTGDGGLSDGLVTAKTVPMFRRFFARHVVRMIRRRFHAARILRGDAGVVSSVDQADGPAIVLLSHPSWWDPLVGLVIWHRYFPSRDLLIPMDGTQLARFPFFRRVGVFGIDPDDPASLDAMRRYVLEHFDHLESGPLLGLTPQGRFTDPREPIRLRPGAAAIAAGSRMPPTVVTIAVEYPFWQDQRPELLMAATACEQPAPGEDGRISTADWQRAMTNSMQDAASRLSEAAIRREPEAFEAVDPRLAGEARINPFMDAWLRLRGRSGGIDARRASEEAAS